MRDNDEDINKEINDILNNHNGENDLLVKLSILKHYDLNKFMDTMFTALVDNPDSMIEVNGSYDTKIEALDKLLEHYTKSEEYEKCQALTELRDAVIEKSWADE